MSSQDSNQAGSRPSGTTDQSSSSLPSSPPAADQQNDQSNQPRPRMPYYTPSNPRQFSDSAAKRDSVMALGSIAHLQHYFVRNGLATKNRSAQHKNMTLAVPGREPGYLSEEDEEALLNLPPEPAPPPPMPSQPQFPAGRVLPDATDLELARQEVMAKLDQVCESWGLVQLTDTRAPSVASNRSADELDAPIDHPNQPNNLSSGLQNLQVSSLSFKSNPRHYPQGLIVHLLTLTTRAVRSVQKFILTIPDPDVFSSANIPSLGSGGDLQRRMSHLELSTAARPRISRSSFLGPASRSSSPARSESPLHPSPRVTSGFDPFMLFKKRAVSSLMTSIGSNSPSQTIKDDPLTILRKMSLEVLGCLKDIEHRFRIPNSATPMDSNDLSIFKSIENDKTNSQLFDSPPSTQIGSETRDQDGDDSVGVLTLPSMSWEYRLDVGLEDVREEALVVKQWLEYVDGILEGMKLMTGSRRKKTRSRDRNPKKTVKKKKSTSQLPKQQSVFKKIINSSKSVHNPNQETQVPAIALGDMTTDDESSSEFENDEDNEELLPDWARNDLFVSNDSEKNVGGIETKGSKQLDRLFSCLVSHLPTDVLIHLCPPHGDSGSRIRFLDCLSDGTLLCLAYNIVLRKSQRPWGFIPVESIHNLINPNSPPHSPRSIQTSDSFRNFSSIREEESFNQDESESGSIKSRPTIHTRRSTSNSQFSPGSEPNTSTSSTFNNVSFNNFSSSSKVGITFRRMENVKVWAAALKLRYLIKSEISVPCNNTNTNLPSSSSSISSLSSQPHQKSPLSNGSSKPPSSTTIIKFDPKVIARKIDGWENMLEYMALKWLDAIRSEKREEILFSK